MSAEIVNLNKARKARERAEERRAADENRMRHGRTKAERRAEDSARVRHEQTVAGAERMPPEPAPRLDDEHDDLDPGSVS